MLLAMLCIAHTVANIPPLAFLPDGHLSPDQWQTIMTVKQQRSERILCRVEYSRHGGSHRSADKPTGGVLVKPAHERRVRVVDNMRGHLDAASGLSFPLDPRLRSSALPPDLQCAVRVSYHLGTALAPTRRSLLAANIAEADLLRPISRRINKLMPPSVWKIARDVNTADIAVWISALSWIDVDLVERWVYGFPVVGDIPDSHVYRAIPARLPESFDPQLQLFQSSARNWNSRLTERLESRASASGASLAADIAVAKKTASEVSKGVVVGPYTSVRALADAVAGWWPNLPKHATYPRVLNRFPVTQNGKTRAIDDGRGNGANAATNMHETVTTPSFFFPAIVARAYAVVASSSPLRPMTVTLLDLSMAYRTVPTCQPWYTSIGIYNPAAHRAEFYWLPGHNFGLTSAVVNFNRYPEFVVVVLRASLAIPAEHYFDDLLGPDLAAGEDTARVSISETILALGGGKPRAKWEQIRSPEIDPLKTRVENERNIVLGVVTDLSSVQSGVVQFYVDTDRIDSVLALFDVAERNNQLTPHTASRLRGKIFFLLSAAFGCVGRAATLTFVQRQYRDAPPFTFTPELRSSFRFFRALLPALPRLSVQLSPDTIPPLLVYTDASFSLRKKRRSAECSLPHAQLRGALGAVVYDPVDHTVRYAAAEPPWSVLLSSWRSDRKTYIAELETLAAVAVYSTYPTLFAGRKVNHFVDNTVALSALVHGYSGKPDLAKPVNIFYLQTVALRTSVYFEYVPSKANIADLPSRNQFKLLEQQLHGIPIRGSAPDPLSVPSAAAWDAPLETWASNPRTWHAEMPL